MATAIQSNFRVRKNLGSISRVIEVPNLIDIRTYGLIAALEFEPIPGKPGARAFDVYLRCFEKGLLVRQTGDILALSPPLIVERTHIDQIFGTLAEVLKSR